MKKLHNKLAVLGAAAVLLILAGCFIVSGTITIERSFSFDAPAGLYHYFADVTDDKDWIEYKDQIDEIDGVGYDIWFTNYGATDVTFAIWIDRAGEPTYTSFDSVVANTTKILDNLTLPPGVSHLTYGNSFSYIMNVDSIRAMGKVGTFHMYGASKTGTGGPFLVDSGKVVFIFTGHK